MEPKTKKAPKRTKEPGQREAREQRKRKKKSPVPEGEGRDPAKTANLRRKLQELKK